LLGAANLKATWISPPSAEEIRAQDQDRLVRDITASAEVTPDEQAAAQAIPAGLAAPDAGRPAGPDRVVPHTDEPPERSARGIAA
jgi:hypothetical protein